MRARQPDGTGVVERGGVRDSGQYAFRDRRAKMLPEAHSTKQQEDCVGWALEAGVETMLAYGAQPPESRHDRAIHDAFAEPSVDESAE